MSIKVLHINCHPAHADFNRSTVQLAGHALELLAEYPQLELEVLHLYADDFFLPQANNAMLKAWFKTDADWNAEEKAMMHRQHFLLTQWIQADWIFIYSPLHNFNVTAKFKAYIDNILIAGRTFKYTENGSVGLLNNSKKVLYVQSSGGAYTQDVRYVNADIAPHYVRTVLSFMGIHRMHLIRVEGLDLKTADKAALIARGKDEITEYINSCLHDAD